MNENVKILRSKRKTLSIEITREGDVLARAPMRMPRGAIERFIESRRGWIDGHVRRMRERNARPVQILSESELRDLAEAAGDDLMRRIERYAPAVGVTVTGVTIRRQKTRWGSCSAKGRLNLNCLLMLCPEEVRDYVVVHELCHRREMNHSVRFWREVERVMPDYAVRRRWLKEIGGDIIRRLG